MMSDESNTPPKKRLTAPQKRARRAAEVARFVRQYARKAQRGQEPNDRDYDHKMEHRLKRLKPEVLDELLRDNDAD